MMHKKIYFFTGASGSGKTTLINELAKEFEPSSAIFLHFDSIGVISQNLMTKLYGATAHWQKAMTFAWVKKMLADFPDK